jgi:hypothetical protein
MRIPGSLAVIIIAIIAAEPLEGCMGRAPHPVAAVQPGDQMMSCPAIYAEIQSNNNRIQELGREKGWKVAQNVAAGVAGFVVPVLWFGMDWQGAAGTEARALQDRQSYLSTLAVQKHCGGPPQRPPR